MNVQTTWMLKGPLCKNKSLKAEKRYVVGSFSQGALAVHHPAIAWHGGGIGKIDDVSLNKLKGVTSNLHPQSDFAHHEEDRHADVSAIGRSSRRMWDEPETCTVRCFVWAGANGNSIRIWVAEGLKYLEYPLTSCWHNPVIKWTNTKVRHMTEVSMKEIANGVYLWSCIIGIRKAMIHSVIQCDKK